jgi:hypothetical protein
MTQPESQDDALGTVPSSDSPTVPATKKISADMSPEDLAACVQQKARKYIECKFRRLGPGEGPSHNLPIPGTESTTAWGFLVHKDYRHLYVPLDNQLEKIIDYQFCDICSKWLKTGRGIQNGERHYLRAHLQEKSEAEIVPVPSPANENKIAWSQVKFFIRNLVPLVLAKDPLFDRLQTSYRLLQILQKIRSDVEEELKRKLSRFKEVALLEDGWTDAMMRQYEGLWVCGHFETGQHAAYCLGHIPLLRADAATIADAIAKRLKKLNFPHTGQRASYFVGDSASVNMAMVRQFNQIMSSQTVFVPCAAHCFNNMMHALWTEVRPTIFRLLVIVDSIRNKSKFRALAREAQLTVQGSSDRSRPITIPTITPIRWYSLCKMLSSSLRLRQVIETYVATLSEPKLKAAIVKAIRKQQEQFTGIPEADVQQLQDDEIPTLVLSVDHPDLTIDPSEWDQLNVLSDIFDAFKELLEEIESDQYGTMADIWRGFLWLRGVVMAVELNEVIEGWKQATAIWERWVERYPLIPSETQKDDIRKVQTRALRSITDRSSIEFLRLQEEHDEVNCVQAVPLYQIVALLRPSNLVQIPLLLRNDMQWGEVVKCFKVLFDSSKAQCREWIEEQRAIAGQSLGAASQRTRFARGHDIAELATPREPLRTEWERYIRLQVLSSDDADLAIWWTKHRAEFPVVYRLVQVYLFVPATSAGVERMFSKARRVLSRLRLRLTPENAEVLVFLRENIAIVEELEAAGRIYWTH